MFHLLVMACTEAQLCAERWLPEGDRTEAAACEAGAEAVTGPWLEAHGMTAKSARCVPTEELPALTLQPVARGVWVHRGADDTAGPGNGGRIANLGVITGPTGTVLIDTGGSRAEAEALLAAAMQLAPQPVVAAIVTHAHPDHSLGTGLMAEAGVPIIGHARLADALAARAEAYTTAYRATLGEAAWHGSGFAPPDRAVGSPTEVTPGGTTLLLTPVATAHSDSDLTVWHGDSGTLFTGDLAFRDVTPVLDGSLAGWLGWLGRDPAPRPAHLVPGHGGVASGWAEGTSPTRRYLDALARAVRAAIAAGRSLGEAVPEVAEVLRPGFGGLADFDATTRRDAAAAFKELEWE